MLFLSVNLASNMKGLLQVLEILIKLTKPTLKLYLNIDLCGTRLFLIQLLKLKKRKKVKKVKKSENTYKKNIFLKRKIS
jgi:hypothetical protein